jgi:hypothetical protein
MSLPCLPWRLGETSERPWPAGRSDFTDTAFRRWCVKTDSAVPELHQVLADAGLSSYVSIADAWCEENGAAELCEVWEEFDDLCSALGVSKFQGRQLYMTLGACLQKEQDPGQGTDLPPLCTTTPTLIRTDSSFQCGEEEVHSVVGQPFGECELKTSLRGALADAGLHGHVAAAEAWCSEMGAACLEEVLEEIETVCMDLHLSQQQQWVFRDVLELYVSRDDSRWAQGATCGCDVNEIEWHSFKDVPHGAMVAQACWNGCGADDAVLCK